MTGAVPDRPDAGPVVVFCLHFLGGSARAWDAVAAALPPSVRLIALDLPGFGTAAAIPGHSIHAMADYVIAQIRREASPAWVLAGHSMGAKVATVIARRAEDGEAGLEGLQHLLLLAGSPPAPEPMEEDRRSIMAAWFRGNDAASRAQAEGYITGNAADALQGDDHQRTVDDVLRADRVAWTAWLEQGSREDWSARIGILRTPATIVAGGQDGDLGPDAQRRLMAPYFSSHTLEVLEGAGHLLPLERARAVAALMTECADAAWLRASLGADCLDLLQSDRVSAATRSAMLDRARPAADPEAIAGSFDATLLPALAAMLARVVPQDRLPPIDLRGAIIAEIGAAAGDGWRYDALPPDAEAWQAGLRTLDEAAGAAGFAALEPRAQDAILARVASGDVGLQAPGTLDPAQMALWFEDVRAAATRAYIGHPATLWRLGFSGLAYAGDGPDKRGFTAFGIGVREDWEPHSPARHVH